MFYYLIYLPFLSLSLSLPSPSSFSLFNIKKEMHYNFSLKPGNTVNPSFPHTHFYLLALTIRARRFQEPGRSRCFYRKLFRPCSLVPFQGWFLRICTAIMIIIHDCHEDVGNSFIYLKDFHGLTSDFFIPPSFLTIRMSLGWWRSKERLDA